MIRTYYHLVLVVGVWLLKKLKIFENLSGFQSSATICIRSAHRDEHGAAVQSRVRALRNERGAWLVATRGWPPGLLCNVTGYIVLHK